MSGFIAIRTNFDRCTGCALCQLACAERHFGGYNPRRALLRVTHRRENLYHFPEVCNQCRNPYCAIVCPVKAIGRNPETGAMTVDPAVCIGCGLCGRYCPVGMIRLDPESKKSVKCDLCGGDPACVAACPTGALEIVRVERSFEDEGKTTADSTDATAEPTAEERENSHE
ncbi:MAG: 4Fe-4S dicluster domain-containing protein [Desulfococcaceae bacterium]